MPGRAAIAWSALKPAIARKSRPCAACVAENWVVAPTCFAMATRSLNGLVPFTTLSPILAVARLIVCSNSIPALDARPSAAAAVAPAPIVA